MLSTKYNVVRIPNYRLSDDVALKAGYRVVENGASVETSYNFAWINYLSVGLIV